MGLLEDLQSVHTQIMEIFNPMLGQVCFRVFKRDKQMIAGGYTNLILSDVVLDIGTCNIKQASAYAQREGSFIKAGDLLIETAGNLISEEQIKGATVFYPFTNDLDDPKFSVQSYRPKTLPGGAAVLDGGAVVWEIVCRQEK